MVTDRVGVRGLAGGWWAEVFLKLPFIFATLGGVAGSVGCGAWYDVGGGVHGGYGTLVLDF